MKYEFIKIDLDTYKLVYTSKDKKEVSIEFKRTIEMAEKLQGIVATARLNMYKELSKQGITKNDLIIKKDDGKGHITYDETNYQEYERFYIQLEEAIILNEMIENLFGKSIKDLFDDMGIDNIPEAEQPMQLQLFSSKLGQIINKGLDDTPSEGNKE